MAALLTANALAVALLVDGDEEPVGGVRAPAAAEATETPPETITLVTTSDGRRFVADPSTPEGRQAIGNARRDGATVTVVPATTSPVAPGAAAPKASSPPSAPAAVGPAAVPGTGLLPRLPVDLNHITAPVTGAVGGVVGTVGGVVDKVQGTVNGAVDGVQGTLPSTPVGGTVDGVQSQIGGVLDGVQQTVGGVPGTTTPGSAGAGPLAPATVTDPLGGAVGTVTGGLGGLTGSLLGGR